MSLTSSPTDYVTTDLAEIGSTCDRQFEGGVATFSAWDYVVFSIVLAISLMIGLYHAFCGGRQKSTKEFLFADRSMSAFPVALSVFASFFSASTILGTPAEIFQQGTMYWMCVWGAMFAPILGALVFGPFFHRMNMVSVYEYLEKRFKSKSVRMLGALFFIVRATLGMGIVLFGPSVALSAVTGFPVWATIVAVGLVCAAYTTLGGMKAVIWTDVFQTGIMLAGLLAAIIQGAIEVGGLERAWKIAYDGGRIEFFDFNPDPTVRHTFWTLVIGNFFVWLPPYTVDQQMIQRFSSTTSLKNSIIALLINAPGIFIMITLCSLLGVIMYAFYHQCDPLLDKRITDPNQLVPRMVMDMFTFAPGVPGLFAASLFCAALSSVSSMINSLAAVLWQDFIQLCVSRTMEPSRSLSDFTVTVINKVLGVMFAGVGIGMAFLFSNVGGTVLQMSLAFNGATGAPMVGLFVLGAFFPCSNWIGALVGGVLGFSFPMWLSIGTYVTKPPVTKPMYRSTECCVVPNTTTTLYTAFTAMTGSLDPVTTIKPEITGINNLYTLSYLWYTATGILITVVIGLLVSFITECIRPSETKIEPRLMISYVDTFWCFLPESLKSRCRCGIPFDEDDEESSSSAKSVNDEASVGDNYTKDTELELKPSTTDKHDYGGPVPVEYSSSTPDFKAGYGHDGDAVPRHAASTPAADSHVLPVPPVSI